MANQPAGNLWLHQHFKMSAFRLTHLSYIGTRDKIEIVENGIVEQTYGPKYQPSLDTPLSHLEFAFKYDDLNLNFLKAIFKLLSRQEVEDYVNRKVSGINNRRIGYLYEWLIGEEITLKQSIAGNYIDLLDDEKYITGLPLKITKWKINDNLLGNKDFCPIIRKSNILTRELEKDLKSQIEKLKETYSPDIFHRAAQYLFRKETKSSYAIENEKPSPDRMNRFIALLSKAGTQHIDELLSESNLMYLQNAIVDPRFIAKGFRDFQNYIGATGFRMEEVIHFICPPPQYVTSLMSGIHNCYGKIKEIPGQLQATVIAFGFVFVHPFDDGNGRLHRFLIHDMLTRSGIVQEGIIIPVSAHMLNYMPDYDRALEDFSKPLMQRIKYKKTNEGEIEVLNGADMEDYFRYPDLTYQATYLAQTINETVTEDMTGELQFLERYDELKKSIQNIVDMPDKYIDQMITFLHQNKGKFPNRRKKEFDKLTAQEFLAMEESYMEIFEKK